MTKLDSAKKHWIAAYNDAVMTVLFLVFRCQAYCHGRPAVDLKQRSVT